MDLNNVYPEFVTRHYGLAFYHDNAKKVIVPLDTFFIGRAQCLSPESLETILGAWLEDKKAKVQADKDYFAEHGDEYYWNGGDFEIKEHYNVANSKGEVRKRHILDLSSKDLIRELIKRVKAVDKTSKLVTVSGKDVFRHPEKEKKQKWVANIGKGSVLTGKIASRSDAREWDKKSYHHVKLVGVMEPNAHRLTSVNCTGMSAEFNSYKQIVANGEGYSELEVMCSHVATLLQYVKDYPYSVEGYRQVRGRGTEWKFWVPINAGSLQPRNLFSSPSKDLLLAEILIARYFNRMTLEQISQKLGHQKDIYDFEVLKGLESGTIGFESVVQYQHPPAGTLGRSVMQGVHECLSEVGFKLAGYVKEGKWGQYEASCPNYVNDKGEEARIWVTKKMPPVVVFRRGLDDSKFNPYQMQRRDTSPMGRLFERETSLDDRTSRFTESEVRIPWNLQMHPSVVKDYLVFINKYHPLGVKGLKMKLCHQKDKKLYKQLFS
ncbi:MAG: hypothetical protein U9R08_04045 [Nanoarchaeota archaeon]|nr:hypothetical protein [Nanoarchaeota archaeon]